MTPIFGMKKITLCLLIIFSTLLITVPEAGSQTIVDRIIAQADSARQAYDFPLAVSLCQKVAEIDSTSIDRVEDMMITCGNGLSMMDFCSQPVVVARQDFPLKDFFLNTIPGSQFKVLTGYGIILANAGMFYLKFLILNLLGNRKI